MPASPGTGQHRSSKTRGRVIKSLPAVAAVTIAGLTMQAAPAQAAPSQPGVIAPQESQPGVTSTPQTAPAAPPPPAPEERQYLPGYQPSPQVQQTPSRSYDDYLAGNQQSSYYQNSYYEPTPAPQAAPSEAPPALQATPPPPPPVPTVKRTTIAPIEAPPGNLIAGGTLVPVDTEIVDQNLLTRINNTLQGAQADGGNWLVDNGFADAPRADRIAAGTATGVIAGGATGLAASAVPALVITGTGAAIGGALGLAAVTAGAPAILPAGPIPFIFVPGAAALAGAGAGAALSAPIVLGLTGVGAAVGGVLGATVLGGEQQIIEEPAPAPAVVPPAAESVPTIPPAATVELPEQVRDTLASDPNGRQALAAADTAVESAAPIVDKAVDDAAVWTAPVVEAAQGFTSNALEQPAVAETVAAVTASAAPIVDQANAALAGLNAAFTPA